MTPTPTATSEATTASPLPKAAQDNATGDGELKPETVRTILGLILSIAFLIAILAIFGYLSEKKDGEERRARRALECLRRRHTSTGSSTSAQSAASSQITLRTMHTVESMGEPLPLYQPKDHDTSRPPSFVERPPCPPPYRLPIVPLPPTVHMADEFSGGGRRGGAGRLTRL